jgi:hypothetical protein
MGRQERYAGRQWMCAWSPQLQQALSSPSTYRARDVNSFPTDDGGQRRWLWDIQNLIRTLKIGALGRRVTNRQRTASTSPPTKAAVEMRKGDVVNRSPPACRHKLRSRNGRRWDHRAKYQWSLQLETALLAHSFHRANRGRATAPGRLRPCAHQRRMSTVAPRSSRTGQSVHGQFRLAERSVGTADADRRCARCSGAASSNQGSASGASGMT